MKNKRGFTLAELLIIVAIIGVLVAISIPIFNSQLRKARLATNQANARAAYAAAEAAIIFEPNLPDFDPRYTRWTGNYVSFLYDTNTSICEVITYNNQGAWDNNAAWIDYYQDEGVERSQERIENWTVNTTGDSNSYLKSAMGDKVYTKWKIDIFKDTTVGSVSYSIGTLSSICWCE